jgi:hypothetical protein
MANMKGPKVKGKNRMFMGEIFGNTTSPKIAKGWGRAFTKHMEHGGKIANYPQVSKDRK